MKRIIIIGATSGIGKELALRYAASGWLVGITGRRQQLLEGIKNLYPQTIFTACFDVTGTENKNFLFRLIEEMGGLDLLIYNAGFGHPSAALDVVTELETTKTIVNGCVEIVGHSFNYFIQRDSGQIAITSSVAGVRGNSLAPAYSAAKAFVSTYAESLNIKSHRLKKPIVVTDIRPGFVATKPIVEHKRIWVASPQKAAVQIMTAIQKKKRVAYVTRRWRLVALLMRLLPYHLYRRLV